MIEILEISGEGCANCYSLLPVLNKIAQKLNVPLRHLEAAPENAEEVKRYEIDRVPSALLLDDGKPFARCSGYQPEEILELWIQAKIEEHRKNG